MTNKGEEYMTNIVKQPLLPDTIHFKNANTEVMRINRDGVWVNPDIPATEAAKAVLDALDSQIKVLMQSAQREWVGLTDEERYLNDVRTEEEIEYVRAIEAKLKEKNT